MIHGNLDGVIAQLTRFRAGVQPAVNQTVTRARNEVFLKVVAQRVALHYLGPDQMLLVDGIVHAVLVRFGSASFVATLSDPQAETATVRDAMDVEESLTTREYPDGKVRQRRVPLDPHPIQSAVMENARVIIQEWVESGAKTPRDEDAGLTPQEIADRVYNILFQRTHDQKPEIREARDRMVTAIDEWLQERTEAEGGAVSSAKLGQILEAILEAWVLEMEKTLPAELKARLKAVWDNDELL